MNRSSTKWMSLLIMAIFLVPFSLTASTTGKISGKVVDSETGDPLPGANVTLVGTSLGAATNEDGDYFILNVPPGTYSVQANMIGYAQTVQTGVKVSINLTTSVNFTERYALKQQAIQGEAVTIVSERPVVQPDVSANIANVTSVEIENLPITSLETAIDLQAGIEPGLGVRGGSLSDLNFSLDGLNLRDGRDNTPFTGISYTSIEEFQVQTGGFNAEYGNVRSGVINVVSKDAPRNKYTADVLFRYSPANDMHFGPGPKDPNAYWMRPYIDPDVAVVGTANGTWDQYTQAQYPVFNGWQVFSDNLLGDDDPTNDLTVAQLQEVFDYHHRKDTEVVDESYELDLTVGGPVPGISQALGDLRFTVSYRGTQDPYFYPQGRSSYTDNLTQVKVVSDIKSTMKLSLQGFVANAEGMAHDAFATVTNPNPQPGGLGAYPWSDRFTMVNQNNDHVGRSVIFGFDRYSITDVQRNMLGGTFTHTISPNTFYQVTFNRVGSKYDTSPRVRRNTTPVVTIGGIGFDQAPIGWTSQGTSSPGSGLRLGGHWARARDTSRVAVYTTKFDVTSQVNNFSELKAGVEMIYSDYDMNYGSDDSVIVHLERSNQRWERQPIQGAAYVQNKFEFKGMIANIGLRADYFDPRGDWWLYDSYDVAFNAKNKNDRETLLSTTSTDKQFNISPRLGVSFPISVNSKLYFNYGHFRQMLTSRELFQIEREWLGNIGQIGDPNQPMPRTVAYELGYDHNILDQFLLRISGYYRDNDLQPRNVQFISIDRTVDYAQSQPLNYGDVRGLELTLNKTRGNWWRGFVNYTFMQFKSGNFGFGQLDQNVVEQRNYLATSTDHYQFKPVSQPYASFNVELFTPRNWGPKAGEYALLEDVRLNVLGGWRSGQHFTWAGPGGQIPGLQNNVQMKDFFSLDLRLSKNINTALGRAQLFLDMNNIFNFKYMYFNPGNAYGGPFEGTQDWENYMQSLHLANSDFDGVNRADIPYLFVPGDDRPGDFRKDGVAFVPIEVVANAGGLPDALPTLESGRRLLYYTVDSGQYMEFVNGAWQTADQGFVNQVLDDKAYIDMPNEIHRTFLNPRSVIFGMRVSF